MLLTQDCSCPDLLWNHWKWKKTFYSQGRCFPSVLRSSDCLTLHLRIKFENLFLALGLFKQICRWVGCRVNSCRYFHSSWFWWAAETKTLRVWCDEFWIACYQLQCHVHCFHLLCDQALSFGGFNPSYHVGFGGNCLGKSCFVAWICRLQTISNLVHSLSVYCQSQIGDMVSPGTSSDQAGLSWGSQHAERHRFSIPYFCLFSSTIISEHCFYMVRLFLRVWLPCAAWIYTIWSLSLFHVDTKWINNYSHQWIKYMGKFLICYLRLLLKTIKIPFSQQRLVQCFSNQNLNHWYTAY